MPTYMTTNIKVQIHQDPIITWQNNLSADKNKIERIISTQKIVNVCQTSTIFVMQ
jgi:hypothetical protein